MFACLDCGQIFDEDEISMLPYGNKIYKILVKLGIYGKENNTNK